MSADPVASYGDIAGRIALVTGSTKALGAATAKAFASQGAKVVIHGRDRDAIDRIANEIAATGGEALGIAADVTSQADLAALQARVEKRFGTVDILACFAGGMGRPVPLLAMDPDLWRQTIELDLTSKFLTIRAFAPAMQRRGSGSIILMSSAAGRQVSEASAAYGAAQAGTLMLMRHLAQELGPSGVRVNAIAPAIVRNEKIDRGMPIELQRQVAESLPLRRIGEPSDVASAALFLASSASSWITGQVLDVTGGKVMA